MLSKSLTIIDGGNNSAVGLKAVDFSLTTTESNGRLQTELTGKGSKDDD